jgi:hypothetical protein
MRRAAVALLLAALGIPAASSAADFDVATLFESLAREKPSRAAFRETKVMALLDRPVESSGELAFTPPSRLEKRTLKPRPESVIIDGDRVTLERGGKRQSFGLRDYPGVAVLVESIRSTLAGDLVSLARNYSLALEGAPARWRLVLRPLDPAAAALAERIEIAGAAARVESVGIFQADGDRSLMTLAPLAR